MGGFGSGRREYATTPTVGQCTHLNSDNVSEFTESPGLKGKVWWGDKGDPDMMVGIKSEGQSTVDGRAGRLRLIYQTEDAETGDVVDEFDYTITLDYTECNFGGYRPWFKCPGCSDRVGKLHMPPGGYRFSCRDCLDLTYYTSRKSGDEIKQAELRYKRAFEKADKDSRRPHPNNMPYSPERPKGMHHDTFERLTEDVREAYDAWDRAFSRRLRRMLRQIES
jgi:hypothetical protein